MWKYPKWGLSAQEEIRAVEMLGKIPTMGGGARKVVEQDLPLGAAEETLGWGGNGCLKDAPRRRLSQDMGRETFKKENSDNFPFKSLLFF